MDHRESNLQREVTDLKCRSMRDNLLFYELPEGKDEDCASTVLHFIESKLEITDATSTIKLQRANRIGTFHKDKIRAIVVKFVMFPNRERVWKSAYLNSSRKKLLRLGASLFQSWKKERAENKEAYINVDKLYINGREFKPDN